MTRKPTTRRELLSLALLGASSVSGCLRLSEETTPTDGGGTTGTQPPNTPTTRRTTATSQPPTEGESPGEPTADTPEPTSETTVTPPDSIDGEWPQYQYGPRNTGRSPAGIGPKSGIGELWRAEVDGEFGHDCATLFDGTIYVKSNQTGRVFAFDALTGEEQWSTKVGNVRGGASPTVADGRLYIGNEDGTLLALAQNDGRRLWLYEAQSGPNHHGVMCSATARDGALYFGDDAGIVYSLSTDGTERWTFETDGSIGRSTPAVVNGTVYVGSMDGRLYALDAGNGQEQWRTQLGDAIFASPAVEDGSIYIGSITATDGAGPLENADGDDMAQERETTGTLHSLSVADGAEQWSVDFDTLIGAAAAIGDGTVYAAPWDGPLYAFDADSGSREWFFPVDTVEEGAPTIADGVVYFAAGRIHAITEATGRELWSFETADGMDTAPIVSDGVVYVGDHDGVFYAVHGKTDR